MKDGWVAKVSGGVDCVPEVEGSTVVVVGERDSVSERVENLVVRCRGCVKYESLDDFSRSVSWLPPSVELPVLVVLNLWLHDSAHASHGEREPSWLAAIRHLRNAWMHSAPVLLVSNFDAQGVRAAFEAGVDELLVRDETVVEYLVVARMRSAIVQAVARGHRLPENASRDASGDGPNSPDSDDEPREVPEAPASAAEREEALGRVRAHAAALAAAQDRLRSSETVLEITAPELRAKSGRLDAKKIAARLGVSLTRLSNALPVSRQALAEVSDSPKIQAALDPIARVLVALDRNLDRADVSRWLNTRHARLADATPLDALLDGRAERVARMVERASEGGVD